MKQTLLLPFKVWRNCRYIPVLLFLSQITAVWLLSRLLTPFLWAEINRGAASGHLPLWSIDKLRLTVTLLPWLAYFPCLFAMSGYPTRLAFLKSEGITIKENFSLWWRANEVSFRCYGLIWRFLPWQLLPVIAVFLTRELLPNFIPPRYHLLSDILLLILAFVTILRTFPLLFAPLIAALGFYDPHRSIRFSHAVIQSKRWNILSLFFLFLSVGYLLLQDSQMVTQYPHFAPLVVTSLTYLFLSTLSGICVPVMAQLESLNT